MIFNFIFLSIIITFSFCQSKYNPNTIKYELIEVAQSNQLWTGVAVSSDGRIFVNYPRWSPTIANSVCEITKNGKKIPSPNEQWNNWDMEESADNYFICVQSIYIDENNYLWILDAGLDVRKGNIRNGPKLLKVDLQSNKIVKKIYFENGCITPTSYLNDIGVDPKSKFAFITDSGLGAIIVINLNTGNIRRVLSEHPSTKAENITLRIEDHEWDYQIHSDGIALDSQGEYLYYQALTGYSLYRIKTQWLKNFLLSEDEIAKKVELVGQPGAADAISFGTDGNLYLTSLEYNAIRRITLDNKIEMVIQDQRLKWPDSFSITPNGDIYVTTSQLHLIGEKTEPYRIFKLSPR